jgi:hypothetical protein
MLAQVNFFKVGRTDEIKSSGWIRVSLLGWDIVVLFHNKEFIAIKRGSLQSAEQKTFLPDSTRHARSGSPSFIDKFMAGPTGAAWGKLQQFPVRVEDDYVFVGVIR